LLLKLDLSERHILKDKDGIKDKVFRVQLEHKQRGVRQTNE